MTQHKTALDILRHQHEKNARELGNAYDARGKATERLENAQTLVQIHEDLDAELAASIEALGGTV